MTEQFLAVFLMGLFGSAHCIGMCGSLCGAATINNTPRRSIYLSIVMSAGRITSYAFAGAITAASVNALQQLSGTQSAFSFLRPVAAIMMILAGLYISKLWTALRYLEKAGAILWRRIQPFSARILPVRSTSHAFLFGLLWGWLPCGLVYSALVWSLSSADAVNGALLMLAFGVGTLPSLVISGVLANQLSRWLQNSGVRNILGLLIIMMGIYNLLQVMHLPIF